MTQWWNSLSEVLRVLYCIAIPATLLLAIQTMLSLMGGMEAGEGVDVSDTSGLDLDAPQGDGFDLDLDLDDLPDADLDDLSYTGDGSAPGDLTAMRLLTLQTVVAFLTVFSWSTIASLHAGTDEMPAILLGLVLGGISMLLVAKMVQASSKLAENGTLDIRNTLGAGAQVYLPIAAGGSGSGKVMVNVQGRLTEFGAITQGEAIETGAYVRVVDLRGDLLVVEREE